MAKTNTELENIRNLLNNSAFKKYAEKRKEFDLDKKYKFNIFETISDTYYVENFHTDILFSILDPNTPEIGPICNEKILQYFVEMVDDDKSFNFKVDGPVNVSKQVHNIVNGKEGYIDLLITNAHNQAIIIENKINDAPDMENQLARYMQHVREKGFPKKIKFKDFEKNVRVVYLTLSPGKFPNIDEYDNYFSKYREMLHTPNNGEDGTILKYRSAVNPTDDEHDLLAFLKNCIQLFNNDKGSLKKIYLEQYKTLLEHLGGEANMAPFKKDILDEIYSSKDNLEAARTLYELLKEPRCRADPSPKAVTDFFDDKLKRICSRLKLIRDDDDKGYIKLNGEYRFYVCGGDFDFEIGFERKINKRNLEIEDEKLEQYKTILTENGFPIADEKNKTYVYSRIDPLEKDDNIDAFITKHENNIKTIRDEFMKIK